MVFPAKQDNVANETKFQQDLIELVKLAFSSIFKLNPIKPFF